MENSSYNCLDLSTFNHFYLMGIKGVAMTSLAQILLDLNKQVAGCDVPDQFVTQKILDRLKIKIDSGFIHQLPTATNCVIYTAAHGGIKNPIVEQAIEKNIPIISQAEALAWFFNQKKGVAVCGVGGKSTVSAMLAWILEKNNLEPSFSVGVGEILGMDRTGQWKNNSDIFIAEADEYVINPGEKVTADNEFIPRFSFLKPNVTICTNLEYDHPDVYSSITHTKAIFTQFFLQIQNGGTLIINQDNKNLVDMAQNLAPELNKKQIKILGFGTTEGDCQLLNHEVSDQTNLGNILLDGQEYQLKLKLPGKFNLINAMAACLAAKELGLPVEDALSALSQFQGTQRRFEFKGNKNGVMYYDDYAHHPDEVKQTIQALKKWHPDHRRVIAFQPHTYSRTKELLVGFAKALSQAEEVLLLDIFPSARENYDPTISSDMLIEKVKELNPDIKISNLKSVNSLTDYCQHQLNKDDVMLTMGAGDIYEIHEEIENKKN